MNYYYGHAQLCRAGKDQVVLAGHLKLGDIILLARSCDSCGDVKAVVAKWVFVLGLDERTGYLRLLVVRPSGQITSTLVRPGRETLRWSGNT